MELKEIYERVKEAQRMLGWNGGYHMTSEILHSLKKDMEEELIKRGEVRRVLNVR